MSSPALGALVPQGAAMFAQWAALYLRSPVIWGQRTPENEMEGKATSVEITWVLPVTQTQSPERCCA